MPILILTFFFIAFKIISVEKTFVVYAENMSEKKRWLESFVIVLSMYSLFIIDLNND